MSFCGYTIFTHKKRQGTKIEIENNDTLVFIRELYRVKPETGNIDYCNCNCVNFPEYIPEKINKNKNK
tara:strand:- start:32 stop:235 length:204 start_codon:yes stop_codon:yes gene_type:complete